MAERCTRRGFMGGSGTAAIGIGLAATVFGAEGKAPPSRTLNLGFIGVGPMGSGHLRGLLKQPDVRVAAVCDVVEQKVAAAIKACGGKPKGYGDFRKLLEQKDIDAVVIATPPHWHAIMCIAACKAGRKAEARTLLEKVIELDDHNETAWLWLSGAVDTNEDRLVCLENVLTINPDNELAQRGLARLASAAPSPQAQPQPAQPTPTPSRAAPPRRRARPIPGHPTMTIRPMLTIRWFTSRGKTLGTIATGQASACPRRPSGRRPHGARAIRALSRGAT